MSFSVLFVCTGNLCRSPAAELLFRARVSGLPVEVSSAGTSGVSGHGMDAASALAVRELGVDSSGHVARRLTTDMTSAADLVLTADSAQRSIIVQAEPLVFRRTFTMREFARLGAGLDQFADVPDADALRARVAQVADQRGVVEVGEPGSDDIGDPIGAGLDVARTTVAVIDRTVTGLIRALGVEQVAVRS